MVYTVLMRKRKEEKLEKDPKQEEVIEADEEGLISEKWSPTKLLIGFTVFLVIFGAGAYFFLSYKRHQEDMGNNILGISQNKQEEELPTKEDVEETVENLEEELNKINPGNLFSSQDSINKMIRDLESLRNTTTDPKGAFCSAVCSSPPQEKTEKTATVEAKTSSKSKEE